jgi:hypothetical protein
MISKAGGIPENRFPLHIIPTPSTIRGETSSPRDRSLPLKLESSTADTHIDSFAERGIWNILRQIAFSEKHFT